MYGKRIRGFGFIGDMLQFTAFIEEFESDILKHKPNFKMDRYQLTIQWRIGNQLQIKLNYFSKKKQHFHLLHTKELNFIMIFL